MDSQTHKGFRFVTAKIARVKGGVRFFFSGYSKFNTVFGPGGFGPSNDRIMTIFSGFGTTSSTFSAAAKSAAGLVRGNALVAFIFGSGTALAEWRYDARKDGYDLTASLVMSLIKALVVAYLTGIIVAFIVGIVLGVLKIGISVLLMGTITLVIGIGIGYGLDLLDKKAGAILDNDQGVLDSASDIMARHFREGGKKISSNWDYLMEKFSSDYKEMFFEKP